jgi:hypothetical protein
MDSLDMPDMSFLAELDQYLAERAIINAELEDAIVAASLPVFDDLALAA